jgi:hypothetical protein
LCTASRPRARRGACQASSPGLGGTGAFHLGRQRVDRPVPIVAQPDQADLAGHRQPGSDQRLPAPRDAERPPQVVRAGGQEDLVDRAGRAAERHRPGDAGRVGLAEEARRVRHLEVEGRRRLVHVRRASQPLEIAYAQAAGTQHRGGFGGHGLEQDLGDAYGLEGLAGAGRLDRLDVPRRFGRHRRERPQRTQRTAVAAQQQTHLPGQLDQLTVRPGRPTRLRHRYQHVMLDQPAHRLGHGRLVQRADRRPVGQPIQHRPGGRRRGQDGPAQLGLVRAQRRRLGVQILGGPTEAGRVRRGHLVHRGHDLEGVRRPVQQEPGPQATDRHPYVVRLGARHGQRQDRVDRGHGGGVVLRRGREPDAQIPAQPGRVEDVQGELVQRVQAPGHRAAGLGAYGQGGHVGRHGYDKVRAQLNQRSQRLIAERPELVDECGGHHLQR